MADPQLDRSVELLALDHYLAFGYVPELLCLLAGVRKLAPGHALEYDLPKDRLDVWRYWSLPVLTEARTDLQSLTDELEALLTRSVGDQMVADVPVGVLLSGGLDSSIVTGLAALKSSYPVRTFTVGFPGHKAFDESPHARLIAQHFGTKHTELAAQAATVDLLPILARQFDEPIADLSMVPTYILSQAVREHCTVALGGDGGDELFGGYKLYQVVQAQQVLRGILPELLRHCLAGYARKRPIGTYGRTYAISLAARPREAVASAGLYLDPSTRDRLAPGLRSLTSRAENYRLFAAGGVSTIVQQLTSADFHSYLPDDILVKETVRVCWRL